MDVTKAEILLYTIDKYPKCENYKKYIYEITEDWSEETKWATKPKYDYNHLSYAYSSAINLWEKFDVTEAVKKQLKDSNSNKGFVIFYTKVGYGINMHSSEYRDIKFRPKMNITTANTAIVDSKKNIKNSNDFSIKTLNGVTWIKLPFDEISEVSIFNIQGKEIKKITVSGRKWYSIKHLVSNGIHILNIKNCSNNFKKSVYIGL